MIKLAVAILADHDRRRRDPRRRLRRRRGGRAGGRGGLRGRPGHHPVAGAGAADGLDRVVADRPGRRVRPLPRHGLGRARRPRGAAPCRRAVGRRDRAADRQDPRGPADAGDGARPAQGLRGAARHAAGQRAGRVARDDLAEPARGVGRGRHRPSTPEPSTVIGRIRGTAGPTSSR
ncbi:MAG: hypothetical protein MZU95_07525 [Desulfomicrobium escambiense]|nr:hypothetical protein [Desulfomicrobium escambiense]